MPTLPTIEKEVLFEQLGYEPHSDAQWSIHDSTARFQIPCCGRRFGKSQAAGHELTWRLFAPDTYIWIVGPTYALAEKEFRVVYNDIVRTLRIPKVKKSNNVKQGDMRIEMPWNTVLEVKSAEKQDGLLGEGLDFVCMSEAARHLLSTWEMYIEPALSDKQGSAIFPSTPRGTNWYKALYNRGNDPAFPDFDSWRFPTWTNERMYPGGFDMNCPNILPDQSAHMPLHDCNCNLELVRIFNTVSIHYWLQEYAAEFTSREGKIYKNWSEETNVIHYVYNPAWPNYWAIDFGYADPFCLYDIQVSPTQDVYVWREYQVRHKTTWEHASIIKNRDNPNGYNVQWAACDPRGADEIATLQLQFPGISFLADSVGWSLGVEAVDRWMKPTPAGRPKFFTTHDCPILNHQLSELQTPPIKEGHNARNSTRKQEGQKDFDDHGPDAVRYFFNEWQVLNAGTNLSDVYTNPDLHAADAKGLFINDGAPLVLAGSHIIPYS